MEQPKKIGMLDFVLILAQRKKLMLITMVLYSGFGIGLSFLLPKHYTSRAVILPPKQQTIPGLGSTFSEDLPVSGILKNLDLFGSEEVDRFMGILLSRTLAEGVIDKFDLDTYYGFGKNGKSFFIEDVLKEFFKKYAVQEDDYGNIVIAFTDTSAALAARIVNDAVERLDSIYYSLSQERGRNSRIFFERRLSDIKEGLDSIHAKFSKFQIKHNYIDFEDQAEATIKVIAELEARKIMVELELDKMKYRYNKDNRMINELNAEKRTIDQKIRRYYDYGSGNILIALKKAPELGVDYLHMYRDVKIQEALYRFVLQLYEQARLTEENNTPSVQVLEHGRPAQKRSKPKRRVVCMLVFIVGFTLTSLYVFLRRWIEVQREHRTETYAKLHDIGANLRFRA